MPQSNRACLKEGTYRFQRAAFRKLPSLVRDPDYARMVAEVTRQDGEQNAASQPPAGERIDLRCVWVAELYTPSYLEGLLDGLAALGWDADDELASTRSISHWVQSYREMPHGGGWFNLGVVQQPGRPNAFMMPRAAPLPASIEYATGKVYALTSSITCVLMAFVFTQEYASRFESALRRTYRTTVSRRGRGYRIHSPDSQKQDAIRRIRTEACMEGTNWFRKHLPGAFSSSILSDGTFPTCELLSLRQAEPFPKREPAIARPEYLRLLGVDNDFEAWHHEKAAFRFSWPVWRSDDRFHAIVGFRESDLNAQDHRHYGTDRSAPTHYISERVDGLLSRWALLALLSGFERKLNVVRDSTLLRPRSRGTINLLRSMRDLVSETVDISAVAAELVRYAQDKRSFSYGVSTFTPCNPEFYRDEKITIGEALRERVAERGAWLGNTDRSIRELLLQYTTVVGVHEDIKLQRRVAIISVLALCVSIVAIWIAPEAAKALQVPIDWLGRILSRFQ